MRHALPAAAVSCALALAACSHSEPATVDASAKVPAKTRQWQAEPAMVSHYGVYRDHEFVYQDYIYDDHGANTDGRDRFDAPLGTPGPDPSDPTNTRQSPAPLTNWAGDFLYASPDNSYIANVADFIEFRAAADAKNVYYRFRMNDMTAPDSAVIAICVDEDDSVSTGISQAWPHGAGLQQQLGCEHLYTVWGTGGDVVDASGATQTFEQIGATVSADMENALIDVTVPKAFADPGRARWRYYIASGVWSNGAWEAPTPVPTNAGAPVATGGSPLAPNIYDLLSNNGEPNSTWNEEKQANDLTAHNILDDYLDVDFGRIASEEKDPDPQLTGVVVRIYHSQFPMEPSRGMTIDAPNKQYNSAWEPYTAVIPGNYYDAGNEKKLWPFDQCLHPLGTNHNVEVFYAEALARPDYDPLVTGVTPSSGYLGFTQITALVDRLQAVYACVLGRGEGIGYQGGDGLVDALEVRDDMLKHYRTDPERQTVHGVSLGAIGTWYVGRLYPDRYAAAMPYIFTSDLATGGIEPTPTLANLYNLPFFYSIGTFDEFGQGTGGDPMADQMEGFGNEYLYLHYAAREHEGRIENDFLPFVAKLAYPRTRVKDPARVRYVLDPSVNYSPKLPFDGSIYWVGGLTPGDATAIAQIDVTSLARADQLPKHQVVFRSVYTNPNRLYNAELRGLFRMTLDEFNAMWHPETWEPGWTKVADITPPTQTDLPAVAVSNGFTLTSGNVASLTLDAQRMKLSGNASYAVDTDIPLTIRFNDGRTVSLPAGHSEGHL